MDTKVTKISGLRNWLTREIKATPDSDFPRKAKYQESLEGSTYCVTIEVEEQNSFIDKKGNKWIREK